MVSSSILELVRALPSCDDFASACTLALRAMLGTVSDAIDASRFEQARVKRAIVHLRPDDGYAALVVLEAGGSTLSTGGSQTSLLPSASVWRLLSTVQRPVALDVNLRVVAPRGGRPEATHWGDDDHLSEHSRARLLDRDATHVYSLPLHGPTGLSGMVSLEATCAAAIGDPFVWEACSDELELLAALAGPYLVALPHRAEPSPASIPVDDPLLPVVGPTMRAVVDALGAFAAEEETLLVKGETGTGKSRIARWCHARSGRAKGPFELLDLLSVPDETQTGELFGWRRGAFTGAVKDHTGYVTRAQGGTLFIDEIDKLSSKAQASLLYLLEERRYRVLGDDGDPRHADVRFIVGTNVDLRAAVAQGRFREDLFYRINVLPVRLPPLRERRDEIGSWATFMLARRHREKGLTGTVTLDPAAAAVLAHAPWPGNLRELDNVVRRAHTLATASHRGDTVVVRQDHFDLAHGMEGERELEAAAAPAARPASPPADRPRPPPSTRPVELTEEVVLDALQRAGYRRASAATLLGISRSSLYGFLAKSKLIPKPSELSEEAILRARDAHGDDLAAMASALRVSAHGLKLRMSELGLGRPS